MSEEKIAIHPSGKKIIFREEEHTYTCEGIQYTSVTTLIHACFPEFDEEYWSKYCSDRDGGTQEELLAEWKQIRDEACRFGSKVHLYAENKLINEKLPEAESEKEQNYFNQVDASLLMIEENYDIVDVEKIVFCPDIFISGMVDLVVINKKTGKICLIDWKTNKEIELGNKFGDRGFDNFSHLDNCNFVHYKIQLNIYGHMLVREEYYKEIETMSVIHLKDDGFVPYEVVPMKEEIDVLFAEISEIAAEQP